MSIGMMRRHYANEENSARVVIDPQPFDPSVEGGVVAIGDEPGTAPTPTEADAAGRDLTVDPDTGEEPTAAEIEGQGEAPEANEQAASEDQNGDPETTVDPVEHPPVPEAIEENLAADPTTDEAGNSLGGPETAPEAPSRGASTATWQTFYKEVLGQDPGERSRDELANDYLGPKPE
ncbi:hypothetical protein SEA_FIRECASTLE_11 [Microbacterium phage FireCastle]